MAFFQMIELAPWPEGKRPKELIEGIIEGLGLPAREPSLIWMNTWVWSYGDIPEEYWEIIKPKLKDRIEQLLIIGIIKWGSWGQC